MSSGISPSSSFLDPCRDQVRVGSGLAAQLRSLPCQRLIKLALAKALYDDARDVGQEVGPARGDLAQLPHRGGVLGFAQFSPSGMTLRRSVQMRDDDPVGLRAVIDHEF